MHPSQTPLSRITLDLQPAFARITLQMPPLNIIDILMMEELSQALAETEANPQIAAIVLSGSQQAFSAGVDVAAHTPENVGNMLTKFHAIFHAIIGSTKVSIAAVIGHVL